MFATSARCCPALSAPQPISLRNPRIELVITEGDFLMFRLSLYVLGASALAAAWAAYRNQQMKKPMPVQKAASMLQQAWADHRTRA
jgi:hypothetical protein